MDTDTLSFRSPHGWLEIFCRIVTPSVPGRQHLRYAVGGHGFSGAGDGFWSEEELRKFAIAMVSLKGGGSDSVQLRAGPNGGLTLDIGPGAAADTLSVVGTIALTRYRTLSEADGLYQWRTEFGFPIRRDGLPNLRDVRWLSTYAV